MSTTPEETRPEPEGAAPGTTGRRVRLTLLIVAALAVGLVARSLVAEGSNSFLVRWLPWLQDTPVTLHFTDGTALVPVSRTLPRDSTEVDLVDALLAGPAADAGLDSFIPENTTAERVTLSDGVLSLALSGDPADFADPLAREAIRQTLTGWEGVDTVALEVGGTAVDVMSSTGHLVYFYDEARDMLVAHPTAATEPRDVLAEFLGGPAEPRLVGLPADIELLEFDYSADSGLLSMDFTYLPSVRAFALDHPEAMRRVLEGLIATMTTGFPQIDGLYLDFEGHATLGLGQCADLLRTLQLQPEVLNDERLLARRAA